MSARLGMLLVAVAGCHGDPAKASDAAIDGPADSAIDAPPDVAIDALSVISYVQGASNYRPTATYPSATLTQPTTAGNLVVVAVSWYAVSGAISKIDDDGGNTYTLATGGGSQSYHLAMYYAANVAPATTISVTMTATVSSADVRAAEYSGLATMNPFEDATSNGGAQGMTAVSGELITTHPHDLLVTATGLSSTTGPGTGFTQRLLENANILEDQEVTTAGAHRGEAALNSNNVLIDIMALKAAD